MGRLEFVTLGKAKVIRHEAEANIKRMRHPPRWMRVLRKIYHEYGLKHALLITILIIYQFIGAAIFYLCEGSHDETLEIFWKESVRRRLNHELILYENNLGIKYTDQKIQWDFWNAMLYAQTICTTIGYGHLYPSTTAGRIFTMLYAIIGIPLVLSILDDLGPFYYLKYHILQLMYASVRSSDEIFITNKAFLIIAKFLKQYCVCVGVWMCVWARVRECVGVRKLLTKCLKTPWYLTKCGCRRLSRYCTKQTMTEIRELDAEDKRGSSQFYLLILTPLFF
uniref:Ion_trans_2 domain-containing protein n=1 Tax=Elaeophora elaphi TaxID=1147741 RepID=A0A0R3RUE2_9BILA